VNEATRTYKARVLRLRAQDLEDEAARTGGQPFFRKTNRHRRHLAADLRAQANRIEAGQVEPEPQSDV